MKRELVKGNEAVAMAAIDAGCLLYFGYPITPQNEIPEYLSKHLPKLGGEFIQAESEVASINMLLGASAAGVRAMTLVRKLTVASGPIPPSTPTTFSVIC